MSRFADAVPPISIQLLFSYVHRLIQNRTDGKVVELPSAATLATRPGSASSHSLDRLTAATLRATKGLGPSLSDEMKMAQLENITLEYSGLLSRHLQQQKQRYDADLARLQGQLSEVTTKSVEGEGWRKKFILLEDKLKSLESNTIPGLELERSRAEDKTQKVRPS